MPNLTVFSIRGYCDAEDLVDLVQGIKNSEITDLEVELYSGCDNPTTTINGPVGLTSLRIRWDAYEHSGSPVSTLEQLSNFIIPSLPTLTELTVYEEFYLWLCYDSDETIPFLVPHHPMATFQSLTTLFYNTKCRNANLIFAIAEMFPNLVELGVIFTDWRGVMWSVGLILTSFIDMS